MLKNSKFSTFSLAMTSNEKKSEKKLLSIGQGPIYFQKKITEKHGTTKRQHPTPLYKIPNQKKTTYTLFTKLHKYTTHMHPNITLRFCSNNPSRLRETNNFN
jgi:hypothetical protein